MNNNYNTPIVEKIELSQDIVTDSNGGSEG